MHVYRTHRCGELRESAVGAMVRLSGWVHRKRDHGQLLFVDLRDHTGLVQIVFHPDSEVFAAAEGLRNESVITVTGEVVARTPETVNPSLATGRIEVVARALEEPFRRIAQNAGLDAPAVLITEAQRRGANFGCDALTGQIVAMDDAGILDSVGVAREALQTAISGAVMALTTETIVLRENPQTSYEP